MTTKKGRNNNLGDIRPLLSNLNDPVMLRSVEARLRDRVLNEENNPIREECTDNGTSKTTKDDEVEVSP